GRFGWRRCRFRRHRRRGVDRPARTGGSRSEGGGAVANVRAGSMTRARLVTATVGLALLASHLALAQAPVQIGPPVQITPPKAHKPKAKPKAVVREKKPAAPPAVAAPPAAKRPTAKKPGVKAPAAKAAPAGPAEKAAGLPPAPPGRRPAPPRNGVWRADRPAGDGRRYPPSRCQ